MFFSYVLLLIIFVGGFFPQQAHKYNYFFFYSLLSVFILFVLLCCFCFLSHNSLSFRVFVQNKKKIEKMAETGPGKDGLQWHRQCITTLGGITSPWALVHVPSLAARLVHALVRLLATGGSSPSAANGRRKNGGGGGLFGIFGMGGEAPRDDRNRNRNGDVRVLDEERALNLQRALNLHQSAMEVCTVQNECRRCV